MIWFQNTASMLICFLLSRALIDRRILDQWLVSLLRGKDGKKSLRPDLFFLLVAYGLSLFFSNTVVVLSLLPLVQMLSQNEKPVLTTRLGLALIFGANIGGMGSLTGAPINLAAVTFLQMQGFPGAEKITFFSWFLFGLPISMGLLGLAWLVLRPGGGAFLGRKHGESPLNRNRKRFLWGTLAVMCLLLGLSALQFAFDPEPVFAGFNFFDVLFLFLFASVLAFLFFWPVNCTWGRGLRHNLFFFGASLLFFPIIGLQRIAGEKSLRRITSLEKTSVFLSERMNRRWTIWFGDSCRRSGCSCRADAVNPFSLVSLNRIFYDLPYMGFLLLAGVIAVFFLLLKIGDNPATSAIDGWLTIQVSQLMHALSDTVSDPMMLILVFVFATVFLTELFNNTLVLFIAGPLLIRSPLLDPMLGVPCFLLLTMASSAAFMSPIATPVNAIVPTSLSGFSLKTMLRRGLWLNLLSVVWLYFLADWMIRML